jgi:hypothetical protein
VLARARHGERGRPGEEEDEQDDDAHELDHGPPNPSDACSTIKLAC